MVVTEGSFCVERAENVCTGTTSITISCEFIMALTVVSKPKGRTIHEDVDMERRSRAFGWSGP